MARSAYRGRSGRIVGCVVAGILLLIGVTSFVVSILLAACLLAVALVYLGDRFDRRTSGSKSS